MDVAIPTYSGGLGIIPGDTIRAASYNILGLYDGRVPPFVKQYAQLGSEVMRAAKTYAEEVRVGVYPEAASGQSQATQSPAVVPLN